MKKLPGPEAFAQALRNKARKYPDREDSRYDDHMVFPAFAPGFQIAKGQSVFTIGSCFARNVEDVLLKAGVEVPTAAFKAPTEEAPGRSNRILNQYNPGTMLQCVQDAGKTPDTRGLYAMEPAGEVVDCLLSTGNRAVSKERAMERRGQISELYAQGIAASNVVVITLGLVEAWYDLETDTYLNEAPPHKLLKDNPKRYEFRQMDVRECDTLISDMLERLIEGGRRKVVLTVSPVPLRATFAGGDAATQNAYSKSVLRVVAEMAAQNFADVDYFPSYEMVTTGGFRSYGEDNVHVRPKVVERVVESMMARYMQGAG